MKITAVETLACDAGWRNYHFVKVSTDAGVTGWSEYDEGFGSPGVTAVIAQLAGVIVGQSCRAAALLRGRLRPHPASSGRSWAKHRRWKTLLDAHAKRLGVPCYEVLGGKVRDALRVYWSHCPAWRINHPQHYGPAITDLAGVETAARCASAASLHRKRTCSSTTKARPSPGGPVFLAVLARARGRARDSQSARHAGSAAARRR